MVHLGKIVCSAGVSRNNLTTAVPFSVAGWQTIAVRIAAADAAVELVSNTSAYATTAALGLPLTVGSALPIPAQGPQGAVINASPILACFSTAGCTLDVWGLWS